MAGEFSGRATTPDHITRLSTRGILLDRETRGYRFVDAGVLYSLLEGLERIGGFGTLGSIEAIYLSVAQRLEQVQHYELEMANADSRIATIKRELRPLEEKLFNFSKKPDVFHLVDVLDMAKIFNSLIGVLDFIRTVQGSEARQLEAEISKTLEDIKQDVPYQVLVGPEQTDKGEPEKIVNIEPHDQ